jgi:hypothetical protein
MAKRQTRFKEIRFEDLNGRQKELYNFQKLAATFADCGYNCMKLSDDWQGADFLAYKFDGKTTLKVQLKSRLSIHKKYIGKEIWIAFPYDKAWYLIEHDRLISKVRRCTKWLSTKSWEKGHAYTSTSINTSLLESLEENRLGPVYGPIAEQD